MRARLEQLLRGSAHVEISGADIPGCLNALVREGIECRAASGPDAFTLRAEIPYRSLRAARAAAARRNCDLRVLRERGLPSAAKKLRRRLALMFTAVIMFSALAASSFFVWDIDVAGAESVPEGRILRALAEAGAKPGSFWPAWDADAITNRVLLAVPELAWAGVSVAGSRAEVRVRERTPSMEPAAGTGSVVSGASGIIERMEVFSGTPLAAVGEAVAEGETLVAGSVTGYDGATEAVRASARISARTAREYTASAPLEAMEPRETASHTRWALVIGNKRVNFYAGSSQTPPGCVKIIEELPLAVEGVFALPVTLLRECIVEYAFEPRPCGADELAAELEALLAERLERELDGGETLRQSFTARESGGRLYVTLRAECREDIAVYLPDEGP